SFAFPFNRCARSPMAPPPIRRLTTQRSRRPSRFARRFDVLELHLSARDGATLPARSRRSPLRDGGGEVVELIRTPREESLRPLDLLGPGRGHRVDELAPGAELELLDLDGEAVGRPPRLDADGRRP